jgi:hypothetical protein
MDRWCTKTIQKLANVTNITYRNKRPMGHIAHLRNLGPYRKYFSNIKYAFNIHLPHLTLGGAMILTNLLQFQVRELSCKIQLFWLHSSKEEDF